MERGEKKRVFQLLIEIINTSFHVTLDIIRLHSLHARGK